MNQFENINDMLRYAIIFYATFIFIFIFSFSFIFNIDITQFCIKNKIQNYQKKNDSQFIKCNIKNVG